MIRSITIIGSENYNRYNRNVFAEYNSIFYLISNIINIRKILIKILKVHLSIYLKVVATHNLLSLATSLIQCFLSQAIAFNKFIPKHAFSKMFTQSSKCHRNQFYFTKIEVFIALLWNYFHVFFLFLFNQVFCTNTK